MVETQEQIADFQFELLLGIMLQNAGQQKKLLSLDLNAGHRSDGVIVSLSKGTPLEAMC